jgi:hypothetical protein
MMLKRLFERREIERGWRVDFSTGGQERARGRNGDTVEIGFSAGAHCTVAVTTIPPDYGPRRLFRTANSKTYRAIMN